jgi:hypothetical protein
MDENSAPQWQQTMRHNLKSSRDLYASAQDSDGIASARPGLSPTDLMSNDQFQHYDKKQDSEFESRGSNMQDYISGRSSDALSYSNKFDSNDQQFHENYEDHKVDAGYDHKYVQNKYPSSNYSTLKSGEYADYSQPLKNHDRNYDTKDTIDRQLDDLKANIRQEEGNKLG